MTAPIRGWPLSVFCECMSHGGGAIATLPLPWPPSVVAIAGAASSRSRDAWCGKRDGLSALRGSATGTHSRAANKTTKPHPIARLRLLLDGEQSNESPSPHQFLPAAGPAP